MKLTAIILTFNEEEHIEACIESLAWADSILVWDSYSIDKTVELAKAAGADVQQAIFKNYAQQRNNALEYLADKECDWVFFVDADERSTGEVEEEIRDVINNRPESGWFIPRHNYLFGNLTLGAGWYPDYQARLFRYGRVRYERPVHEVAEVDGERGHLENPLTHHNYKDVVQFDRKNRKYAFADAKIMKQEGVRPKFYTPVTQPLRQFWWRYVTLHGFKDGFHGFRLSVLMAYYEWLKYKFLRQES